jgi:hypothetical protein
MHSSQSIWSNRRLASSRQLGLRKFILKFLEVPCAPSGTLNNLPELKGGGFGSERPTRRGFVWPTIIP